MAANETHYTLPLPEFKTPVKLLIVVAPYYKDITDQLVAGAQAVAAACGASKASSRCGMPIGASGWPPPASPC